MWSIVIFTEENAIEVIPTSWVVEEENRCYWPNEKGSSLQQKISSCEAPDKASWETYDVRYPGGHLKVYSKLKIKILFLLLTHNQKN